MTETPTTYDAARPPRAEPSLGSLADYWLTRADDLGPGYAVAHIGWGEPSCHRCGWLVPEGHDPRPWLDRAHLIDRAAGGLDTHANVVPLCHLCHRSQPMFLPGQEAEALDWLKAGDPKHWAWQLSTDTAFSDGPRLQRAKAVRAIRDLRHRWEGTLAGIEGVQAADAAVQLVCN